MREDLEQRLRYSHNLLPTLPGIALRIIDLANDPNAEMADIAKIIAMDSALVIRILKVANSPLYSVRRKSNNLRQAISLLGLNATLSLALGFSLSSPLQGIKRLTLDDSLYWRRSIIAAITSRTLGAQQGFVNQEELFLGGLLQDIGMLVFDSMMPTEYGPMVAAARSENKGGQLDHERLIETERQMLGTDHAEVGAWLLRHWNMPEYLQWIVAGNHNPAEANIPTELVPAVSCVAVSGYIADVWLNPEDNQASIRAAHAANKWLGIGTDGFFTIFNAIGENLPEVSNLFEIKLVDPTQIACILAEAREILEVRNSLTLQEIAQTRQDNELLKSRTVMLEQQNRLDPLTGLLNRGWLDHVLNSEFERANENGWPLSIAFIDLDHFKQVNDNYGHQAGDQILKSVARFLTETLRSNDIIGRYGGEEFLVVLPGVGLEAMTNLFKRIITALGAKQHAIDAERSLRVTASIGIASHPAQDYGFATPEALVRAADQMVYIAKRQGRNQVIVYPGSNPPVT